MIVRRFLCDNIARMCFQNTTNMRNAFDDRLMFSL